MNLRDGIDNDDVLFQFDVSDTLKRRDSLEFPSRPPVLTHPEQSCPSHQFNKMQRPNHPSNLISDSGDMDESMLMDRFGDAHDTKGKSVSQPMLIRRMTSHDPHDTFALSLESSFSSGTSLRLDPTFSSSPLTPSSTDFSSVRTPNSGIELGQIALGIGSSFDNRIPVAEVNFPNFVDRSSAGKGKAREHTTSLPPVLPPLSFSSTLSSHDNDWPSFMQSSIPGPSSHNSSTPLTFESPTQITLLDLRPPHNRSTSNDDFTPVIRGAPSRRHSFSNLSVHSTHSVAAQSLHRVKVKSRSGSNIARKFLFRKRSDSLELSSRDVSPPNVTAKINLPASSRVAQGSCFLPGCVDLKNMVDDDYASASVPAIDFSNVTSLYTQSAFPVGNSFETAHLKSKGRSNSSPFPLASSPLDIISLPEFTLSAPVHIESRDLFDELLPRELKLQILSLFVASHQADFHQLSAGAKWTVLKASSVRNKWVGWDKGIRELLKLGRVSRAWWTLVFDGQLWRELDLSSFPKIPSDTVSLIASSAGPFITNLNMTGHNRLLPSTLLNIGEGLCLGPTQMGALANTQLTSLNLQGCSAITTHALHHLLTRSPLLEKLCVKGLAAVSNATCEVLATHCRQLSSLNMSRCLNLDGEGLQHMASAALTKGDVIPIRELRLSGLKRVTDNDMSLLGKAAPYLEVLDLSYIGTLHNSAIDAFVACSDGDDLRFETVLLSSREMGRDPGDSTKYRRRVTLLRHLLLSSCSLLTDIAASHLAHVVPRLENFEMSGIGSELRDDGLVRLFNTTPYIRKVDLEDAPEITNSVIQALTPDAELSSDRPPQPGHALEHLVVSYAVNITNDAFSNLIRKCSRLRILEADSTRLSGSVVKEFIKLCRQREMVDAKLVTIDCRNVGDNIMKDVTSYVRPRLGWRSYDARKLAYLDGRDKEDLDVGLDECDVSRVVLKTFYTWQIVDLVKTAREKRQKTKKGGSKATTTSRAIDDLQITADRRWWSPGSRRMPAGTNTPTVLDVDSHREGCVIM